MPAGRNQFFRFALVGAAGFVVDAGALTLLIAAGLGPLPARLPSFLVAATFTWALNRRLTFPGTSSNYFRQWGRFLLVNSAGGAVNLAVYTLIMWPNSPSRVAPVLGVAAGALSGLVFNFTLSKKLVFRNAAGLILRQHRGPA